MTQAGSSQPPVEPASERPDMVSAVVPTFNRRDEVLECVRSLLASTYPALEVVVVDNASSDGTAEALAAEFGGRIRLIRSEGNLFAGGGRNLGARHARGRYLLFVDSDNLVADTMAEELVRGMEAHPEIGLGGPMMYYRSNPDRFCWTGGGHISLLTSQTTWEGSREPDRDQYAALPLIRVGHIPNVFMLERELFEAIGGIDPVFRMHYEESDLAEKVKRAGRGVALFPRAKTWHNIPFEKPRGDRPFSGKNTGLLYYSVRNRILFMRRNSRGWRLLVFLTAFAPLFLLYNVAMLVWNGRFDLLGTVLRANAAGYTSRVSGEAGR
jgi:GT2 family glycosyltransferase